MVKGRESFNRNLSSQTMSTLRTETVSYAFPAPHPRARARDYFWMDRQIKGSSGDWAIVLGLSRPRLLRMCGVTLG